VTFLRAGIQKLLRNLAPPPRLYAVLALCTLALALALLAGGFARAHAQGVVYGNVIEAGSERPIDAAIVHIAGTNRSVLTDASGHFSFSGISAADVKLEIQRIGYLSKTQLATTTRAVSIELAPSAVALDEVVVTGTAGATRARAIGNAVSRTAIAEAIKLAPAVDLQQVLVTRVAGLVILPMQGMVGTGGVTRIRGVSSLFLSNEPLVYIDGVRVDNNAHAGPSVRGGRQVVRINDLPPEDIESVEVIKGPAAATLYGTEASRGVIQVLTQRGAQGPPRFSMSVKYGANWLANPGGRFPWVFGRNPVTGGIDSVNLYMRERSQGRPIFTTGHPSTLEANVSGGTPNVRYFASANFDLEEGTLDYNWRKRVSARANLTVVPNDKLEIQSNFGVVRNRVRLAQAAELWDIAAQLNLGSPLYLDTPLRGFYRATPETVALVDSRSYTDRAITSMQLKHRPRAWLEHRLISGADIGDETNSILFPSDAAAGNGPFGALSAGDKTVERLHQTFVSLDYSASATSSIGSRLKLVSSLGTQYSGKRAEVVRAHGSKFPVGVSAVAGAALTDASEDAVENRTVGAYAQQQLSWNDRVTLTGALRADDNSAFGPNFDFVTYPKLSAAWVINEEPFWRGALAHIDALKLRAAWGAAGRQPDQFAALRSYQPITTGGNFALTPQNLGNPDVRPERSTELELGFDAGLFSDRIATQFTYFSQRTRDALVPRLLAPSSGFPGNQLVNAGTVRNRGFELSLDARVINRAPLAWDLGFIIATNDSRIETLGGLPPLQMSAAGAIRAEGQWHIAGYPIGSYFLPQVVSASLDPNGNLTNVLCADSTPDLPAVQCASAPRLYAGRSVPSWDVNVRTSISLRRNIRLSAAAEIRGGNKIWYQNATFAHRQVGNTRAIVMQNDPVFLAYDALAVAGVTGANVRQGLIDGGFAKLREISLSYTMPRAWAARLGASAASITVVGRNPGMLWQQQKEVYGVIVGDPETRSDSDLGATIISQLPHYAQMMTAVRLSF
jgi:outer membrane receptor protein involved in Fe transport